MGEVSSSYAQLSITSGMLLDPAFRDREIYQVIHEKHCSTCMEACISLLSIIDASL